MTKKKTSFPKDVFGTMKAYVKRVLLIFIAATFYAIPIFFLWDHHPPFIDPETYSQYDFQLYDFTIVLFTIGYAKRFLSKPFI